MSEIVIEVPPVLSAVTIELPDGSVLNPDAPVVMQPVVVQPPGAIGPQGIPGQIGPRGEPGEAGPQGQTPEFRVSGEVLETRLPGASAWTALGNLRGPAGIRGDHGADGATGVGIASAALAQDGHLILTLTSGQTVDVGNVRGADGQDAAAPEFRLTAGVLECRLAGSGTWNSLGDVKGAAGADGTSGSDGVNGTDGRGVASVAVQAGRLSITYTDGTTADAGALPSTAGQDGLSVTGASINGTGRLILTLSDGSTIDAGVARGADGPAGADGVGSKGDPGDDGADGVGISALSIDGAGHLIVTLSSGAPIDAGQAVGPPGPKGDPGGSGPATVVTDGSTITGDGSAGSPLVAHVTGSGLPAGGAPGQVLTRTASGPAWVDVAGGGVTAAQFAALVARVVALEPAAPVASYLYYRFTFTGNGGHPNFLLVLDVQLREFVGGTQIATGGQASGTGSYPGYQYQPTQAFDGDPATFWLAYPAQTPTLKYQLPAAAPVRQYTLRCGGEANAPMTSMPAAWVFEGSNDNLSWDTLHTVADAGPWTEYQTKTYAI